MIPPTTDCFPRNLSITPAGPWGPEEWLKRHGVQSHCKATSVAVHHNVCSQALRPKSIKILMVLWLWDLLMTETSTEEEKL